MFVFINGRERRWHLRNVSWQLLLRVCVCVFVMYFFWKTLRGMKKIVLSY